MKLFAVIMVLIAGTMWAGTGLAAQDFFRKSSLDAMDLTVFRMFSAGIIMFLVSLMKGQWKAGVRAVKRKPLLFLELVFMVSWGLCLCTIPILPLLRQEMRLPPRSSSIPARPW